MDVSVLLYDGVTAAEVLGPYGVFRRAPETRVVMVAARRGPQTTQGAPRKLIAEATLGEHPRPDVVVVPGGLGSHRLMTDTEAHEWVRAAHETALFTTAISTGSLLLGAAGLLDGVEATTHWLARDDLEATGAHVLRERVVRDKRVMTAAGAIAALEMALGIVACRHGEDVADEIRKTIAGRLGGSMKPLADPRPSTLAPLWPDADAPAVSEWTEVVKHPFRRRSRQPG